MVSVRPIPWAAPTLSGNEAAFVASALSSSWISGGPFVQEFEQRVAEMFSAPYALAVANGTAALHLAYLALDLQPGDEIVVPGFGFLAAANVALHMHARPVFAEVDPHTWCVTAKTIASCITARTKAIVPIHTYGNVCPMDEIRDLAVERNIAIVEDAAEAFGCRYRDLYAGTFGTVGCYSFQATKTITTGEGGMVLTRDPALFERMSLYRSHGMLRKRYWHEVPGHNFRFTNLQAALGCAQLDQLDRIIKERDRIHRRYRDKLGGQHGVILQQFTDDVHPVLWAMACRLDTEVFPQSRDAVMNSMAAAGVETRPGFYPPSCQPIYDCPSLPVSEVVSAAMISLPTFPDLTDDQIDYICLQLLSQRNCKSGRAA